ncbi:hypothetical protein [Bradyrhizobium sp. CB3481]|uniref:hypothetical protein n=1 Tax=Bradyrhizobium sp. CB3481 TaxID=3039158 RepID=UPI0024B086E9|nr:hypothetical protein [Bradyrhizobium sp. CB3481]WFU18770.1 hypothetical protein QA643_10760 [Bradyrhizobium sp. CB3481]
MRKASPVLFAVGLALLTVPNATTAGTLVVVPGIGYPSGFGYARLYGHPFDDGYDYPFGYGEYAEYGPWAYRNACYVVRRAWTGRAWRQRAVRVCD